jgi:nicotinate-nucleotide pyrophosphorylase (carboxylating)
MSKSGLNFGEIKSVIDYALKEDIGSGDITTNLLIPIDLQTKATMVAKSAGIIAGLDVAAYVFRTLSPDIIWKAFVNDGDKVEKGDLILEITGSYRALLTGERLALNFLQRMSGIATMTASFVNAVTDYKTKILDTRKTVPGLRLLDKYAVMIGGGTNHRIGLYDMVLIKDNHIKVAGGISKAVAHIKKSVPDGIKIEVETTTIEEVNEALAAKVDVIMLDNMTNTTMADAVKIINGRAKVEASGNMTLERLKEVAATGVDYISIGALTHSVVAFDISMNIES